jgi:hypothetical protein
MARIVRADVAGLVAGILGPIEELRADGLSTTRFTAW